MPQIDEKTLIAGLKKKVEKELVDRELDVLEFWKGEVEKLSQRKSEGLGSLQLDLKNLLHRMENRIKILKTSSRQ